ncbi:MULTISPECIES: Sec-independent protein translocase protein TatB [unclassified Devosia]|uniref:Sec-independent protein translocase protein TatB n=1 Tax=unclassified Devosia TaxID=196773 RepID=UPI001552107E|nr:MULTISPECIES: Sec-independent protein translocase protein TatB [unclassified Devosia]
MLGLGWTEMLVIGVVALIVIGPKDLPVVMQRVGKIVGQIRRMGNEFQREINKTTGLDEVRNLRNSITAPLKKTSEEIRREFNAMTPTGPKPSGIIKPADPAAESVVDEIRAAAGIQTPAAEATASAPAPLPPAQIVEAPVQATPAPTAPVTTTELAPLNAPATPKTRKPRTKKSASEGEVPDALPTEPADSPAAPTPRQPRKRSKKPSETEQVPALPGEPADSPAAPTPLENS